MKLYHLPGPCSLASRIVLREAVAEFDLAQVERGTGRTTEGEDYGAVNPPGYVPALAGTEVGTLVENGALLPYLAERFGFVGGARCGHSRETVPAPSSRSTAPASSHNRHRLRP